MFLKSFLDKFPPPEYLSPYFSAIVFSDTKLKALSLDKRNLHPVFYVDKDLPQGAIEAGIIKDESKIIDTFKEIKSSLKSDFVKFAVPDSVTYTFNAKVPVFPGKTAEESVSFIMEENVPLPFSEINFDFVAQKIYRDNNAFTAEVSVVAASSANIQSYVSVLENAGLVPLYCINESQSVARAVIPREEEGNNIIISIHSDSIGFYVTSGRVVQFSSILALAPSDSESFSSLVIAEFKKIVSYWSEANKGNNLKDAECFLCGKYEICKPLKENMSKVSIKVSFANVWKNAFSLSNFVPEISFEDSLRIAGAVGLFV